MVQMSISLPEYLRDYVEEEAARMHISSASFTRTLILVHHERAMRAKGKKP
jgi:hypothetical protein